MVAKPRQEEVRILERLDFALNVEDNGCRRVADLLWCLKLCR